MFSRLHGRRRRCATLLAAGAIAASAATAAASGGTAYADTPQSGHTYRITTSASLAVDVSGASLDDNAPVIQWPVNGGPNQSWRVQQLADGNVWIVNVNSGKCLSVNGASLSPGAGLVQFTCYTAPNEEWYLEPVNSGTLYKIRSVAQLSNVVDVPGGTVSWGTQLEQWSDNGGTNQQFFFTTLS
jgi:hypothetical protein